MNHRRPLRHRPDPRRCTDVASSQPAVSGISGLRLPVADVDTIDDPSLALTLIGELASDPPAYETLAILLDAERRGSTIMNIHGTVDNDSILHVADHIIERGHRIDHIGAVIIASMRPGGSDELDDVDRWLTIDEQLSLFGIELVEWFVIGRSVSCPRALLGDAPRWAA